MAPAASSCCPLEPCDGPFVDAKEHLGGFGLVEVDDLDAALEIAARIPAARMGGAVEVRPLLES